MGGVHRAQSFIFNDSHSTAQSAQNKISKFSQTTHPIVSTAQWKRLNETIPRDVNHFPLQMLDGSVNLWNAYGPGDDKTPLQFVYKAAEY